MRTIKPNQLYRSELEIKRSRFIASLFRVNTEGEARVFIEQIRSEFPNARHNCTAFLYTPHDGIEQSRSNDDGEPGGTAGRPMLEALQGSGLTNLACVVTRYFGGIKLGTGGLVRAYTQATQEVLKQAEIYQVCTQQTYWARLPLAQAGKVMAQLNNHGYQIKEQIWNETWQAQITAPAINCEELSSLLSTWLGQPAQLQPGESLVVESPLITSS